MRRPDCVLTLRPLPGNDGARALRSLLKIALRKHGLRCTEIRERASRRCPAPAAEATQARRHRKVTFSNGLRFSLNVTNVQAMLKVLGSESDDWLGETIELSAGKAKFKDELVDSVVLRVVARHPETEKPKVKPPRPKSKDGNGGHGDLDDQIPW
jgi:hypothetical protein